MTINNKNELIIGTAGKGKGYLIYDEGHIGHFATEEEKEKLKVFAQKMHKLTNQHLKK